MMEHSPCESFKPLDLPNFSTHGDEEPETPNSTIEPVPLAIVHNFLRCTQGKRPFHNLSRPKNPT